MNRRRPGGRTKDGAECIYAIVTTQGMLYYMNDDYVPTLEIMKENVYRQVELFFAEKVSK